MTEGSIANPHPLTSGVIIAALGYVPADAKLAPPYNGSLQGASFGIKADGVTDDTAALQLAIDTAIYTKNTALVLPAGTIRITKTIHVGYGVGGYTSLRLSGQGVKYAGEGGFSGTAIVAVQTDSPAINIQGGRHVVLEDLTIMGQNYAYLSAPVIPMQPTSMPAWDDTVGANWVDPAILAASPNADSRYAPYAGVAIDAYAGAQPAPHYPAVTYPSAFVGGGVAQYNKNFTSNVELNRVQIMGFVVGVVVQPCNADGNGDFVTLRKSSIQFCRYGVSIGNSQSRNVGLTDCDIAAVHTLFTSVAHGVQHGRFGGPMTNLSAGNAYQIFDFIPVNSGPVMFTGFYAEALYRIGDMSAGAAADAAISFYNSLFDLTAQEYEPRGVPPAVVVGGSTGVLKFSGCTFINYPWVCSFFTQNPIFEECQFFPHNAPANLNQRLAHNGTAGGLVWSLIGANGQLPVFRAKYSQYDVDGGASRNVSGMLPISRGSRSYSPSSWARALSSENASQWSVPLYKIAAAFDKGSFSSIVLVEKTLTLVFTARDDFTFATQGPLPGDVIWDDQTGMTFRVDTRAALTVTATALNNYKLVAGVYQTVAPFSTGVGNLYFLNTRYYTTSHPIVGTTAAGSGVMTAVGRADGFAGFIAEIQVNDWMTINEFTDLFWNANGTKVTAVDAVAKTLTLAGTANLALAAKVLPAFIRWTT